MHTCSNHQMKRASNIKTCSCSYPLEELISSNKSCRCPMELNGPGHLLNPPTAWKCSHHVKKNGVFVNRSPDALAPTVLSFSKFLQIGVIDVIPYLLIDLHGIDCPVNRDG